MNEISKHKVELVKDKCCNKCYYCNFDFKFAIEIKQTPSIDHLTPRKRGGDNHIDNLVLSCKSCNSKKGKMCEEDYYTYLEIKSSKEYLKFLEDDKYYKALFKKLKNG